MGYVPRSALPVQVAGPRESAGRRIDPELPLSPLHPSVGICVPQDLRPLLWTSAISQSVQEKPQGEEGPHPAVEFPACVSHCTVKTSATLPNTAPRYVSAFHLPEIRLPGPAGRWVAWEGTLPTEADIQTDTDAIDK